MQISIELPDNNTLSAYPPAYYQTILMLSLYHLQQLSEYDVCETLKLNRREFAELLAKYGFSAMADDNQTIATELNI